MRPARPSPVHPSPLTPHLSAHQVRDVRGVLARAVLVPIAAAATARVAARVAFAVVVARVAAVAVARVTARVAAHVAAHVTAAVASRVAATVAVPVGATATARVATQCVCVVVFFFAEFTTFIELERVPGEASAASNHLWYFDCLTQVPCFDG